MRQNMGQLKQKKPKAVLPTGINDHDNDSDDLDTTPPSYPISLDGKGTNGEHVNKKVPGYRRGSNFSGQSEHDSAFFSDRMSDEEVTVSSSLPEHDIPDYRLVAIFVGIFCFLPLGVAAFVFAYRAMKFAETCRFRAAERSLRKARFLIIAAILAGIACVIFLYILGVQGYEITTDTATSQNITNETHSQH